ncbi:MAG TPA: OHCU decarboxylase, partial [Alteromonas macleodii]|nr:OHCU decarboxylase [Alteromonas macleodii]
MILKELNTLSAEEASSWFEQCCAAKTWVYQMVKARPYSDKNALVNQAKSAWA